PACLSRHSTRFPRSALELGLADPGSSTSLPTTGTAKLAAVVQSTAGTHPRRGLRRTREDIAVAFVQFGGCALKSRNDYLSMRPDGGLPIIWKLARRCGDAAPDRQFDSCRNLSADRRRGRKRMEPGSRRHNRRRLKRPWRASTRAGLLSVHPVV